MTALVDLRAAEILDSQDTYEPARKRQRRGPKATRGSTKAAPAPQDELQEYLAEPLCTIDHYSNNPIAWWRDIGSRKYPRLSYMAVDFLSIPSSTAETERQFNSVAEMMSGKRGSLGRHLVACAQSIRSWSRAGVYQACLPFNMLDRKSVEELVSIKDWNELLRD